MQERDLLITNRASGTDIHATYRPVSGRARGFAVIGHGLHDNRNHPLMRTLAMRLSEAGIETVRFDMAAHGDDERPISSLRMHTFADDFTIVVEHCRERVRGFPIIELGHSLGGLAIISARPLNPLTHLPQDGAQSGTRPHDYVILLDASHSSLYRRRIPGYQQGDYTNMNGPRPSHERHGHWASINNNSTTVVFPDEFARSLVVDSGALAANITCPVQVIAAMHPRSALGPFTIQYIDQVGSDLKELIRVEGATHMFEEPGVLDEAIDRMIQTLDRHMETTPALASRGPYLSLSQSP